MTALPARRTPTSPWRAPLFKVTFAGALVALALAVTYASSADAFSDFDRRTIAAFGGTATAAALLLTLAGRITIAALALVGRSALILLALITLAGVTFAGALAVTWSSPAEAFSVFDTGTVAAAFDNAVDAALLAGALLLLPPAARLAANLLNSNALLTLITLAGVTTAHLVHTDLWAMAPAGATALCAAAGFALFVAFRVIDDRPRAGAALSAAALAGLAAVIVGHAEPRVESVSGDVSNIRNVSLSKTPNLYFISFDALVPRTLLKKYLDVETTGFHTLFDAKFRRFPNLFANAVPTKESLYTLLALDPQVYNSQTAVLDDPYTISGRHPSPLLGILRGNGYETSTVFQSTYFGARKGPWVDNYIYFEDRTLCSLLDEAIRPWAFWGYCRWFRHEGSPVPPAVERITSVDADSGPQFMMAHLFLPAHTSPSFRLGDAAEIREEKQRYLRNIEEAAGYLDRVVRHVEADPDAILLVYSDHGMLLSRGVEFDDDPEFFIQDRYGVLGGVFPPDACALWFDAAAAPGWMTLLDAVHAVLRCLSDGKGALVEPRTWVIDPGGFPAMRPPSEYRKSARYADFDDFLYE